MRHTLYDHMSHTERDQMRHMLYDCIPGAVYDRIRLFSTISVLFGSLIQTKNLDQIANQSKTIPPDPCPLPRHSFTSLPITSTHEAR